MTTSKILRAAAFLSMMTATPVFAQAAIQEPGAFAFYHPDADVLHAGRPTPAETGGAMASVPLGGSSAYASMDSGAGILMRPALPFLRSGIGYVPGL